ncbi:metallophosphoesterase [Paucisalibacillus sp. EB02]|uniref:metallophosphoesterase n=1 Tax=Paucisalibacillus sp. EB02 TaxID=1347087 RepID=UPI0004B5CFA3|nr:metallophosphoesterase [Paucisalibacillus sp. EB02]
MDYLFLKALDVIAMYETSAIMIEKYQDNMMNSLYTLQIYGDVGRRFYRMGWNFMRHILGKKKKKALTSKYFLWGSGVLLLSSLVKAYVDTNIFKINSVPFRTRKIPSDAKISILQLTDVHNKVFGHHNKKLVAAVKESNADIVVLTGDLINRGTEDFTNMFSFVTEIVNVNQNVFYVTGNHEMGNENVEVFLMGLHERGVTLLRNHNTQITIGNSIINIVGIDNESTNHEDLGQAFDGVNKDRFTILLSHSPSVVENYASIPADLILSGHTHGGQVRFPLIGAIVGPDNSYFPVLDKGVFEFEQEQYLYIDSGLGTTGYPVRFLNQSQISLIEVSGKG